MMIISSLLLVNILALVSSVASDNAWIKKVHSGAEYMIVTRGGNYAIKSPDLLQQGWSVLYVNGKDGQLVTISPRCAEGPSSMGEQPLRLIDSVRNRLDEQAGREVCNIQLGKRKLKNLEITSYGPDGSIENILSVNTKHEDDEIAIVGQASVFFQQGVLTVVDHDGRIQMRPAACLTSEEEDFLERLREAQETYRRVKRRSERLIESITDEFITTLSSTRKGTTLPYLLMS